jgi:hypothetical protein
MIFHKLRKNQRYPLELLRLMFVTELQLVLNSKAASSLLS